MTDTSPVYSGSRTASGALVFISGKLPVDIDGTVPSDITAQTKLVLDNIETELGEHGLDWTSVVKLTYFLRDIEDLDAVRAVLRATLPQPRPAASLIEVSNLVHPHCKLEVEAIAQRPSAALPGGVLRFEDPPKQADQGFAFWRRQRRQELPL